MEDFLYDEVDFVFSEEISLMHLDQVILKSGKTWKRIDMIISPTHVTNIKHNNAGTIKEETVCIVTDFNPNFILKEYVGFTVVLRMKKDNGITYVGSKDWPCTIHISSNLDYDKYTFQAKSSD